MWDGTQWVPDVRSTAPHVRPTASPKRSGSQRSNIAASAIIVILGVSLLVPFSAGFAATSPTAKMTVAPGGGLAGSSVEVQGAGFPAWLKVQLTWDGQRAGLPAIGVSRYGTFRVDVIVPAGSKAGQHTLGAVSLNGKGFRLNRTSAFRALASASFAVAAPAPAGSTSNPTPGPTTAPAPTSAPAGNPTAAPTPTTAPTTAPSTAPTTAPSSAPPSTAPTTDPTPTPAPATPKPTATPAPTSKTSGPIQVSSDNVTIDGVTITSSGTTGAGISATGSASNPINNLTIRNCTIKGFHLGIYLRFVSNVTIENCTITDADYAGIAIFSGIGGTISGNTIQRIGMTRTDFSDPGMGNNAYGIMLNRSESSSLTSDPPTQNFMVDHNTVTNVPLWMCLNLHGARNITFSANTTGGCPRAIFIAGSPTGSGVTQSANVTVTGNRLEAPTTKSGGTTDLEGVLIASLQGGKITNNAISKAYTPPVYDYQGNSVNVSISGTTGF